MTKQEKQNKIRLAAEGNKFINLLLFIKPSRSGMSQAVEVFTVENNQLWPEYSFKMSGAGTEYGFAALYYYMAEDLNITLSDRVKWANSCRHNIQVFYTSSNREYIPTAAEYFKN